MTSPRTDIPDAAIEALARLVCREATEQGFTQIEYVKLVNAVLDESMRTAGAEPSPAPPHAPATRLPLRGPRVAIRALDPACDLPLLDRWLADASGRDFLLSRLTARQADLRELLRAEGNAFGIVTLPDAVPIGAVAFLDHDPAQRKAEMRKLIGEPSYRGKGLAKEASALWIRYGLAGLGLRKIYVSTFHTNVRNVRLNQELGFRVEGILRSEVLVDGAYHDVLRMGLWREGEPREPEASSTGGSEPSPDAARDRAARTR